MAFFLEGAVICSTLALSHPFLAPFNIFFGGVIIVAVTSLRTSRTSQNRTPF
jgi:hypothetical protein